MHGDRFTLLDIYDPMADAWSTVGAFPQLRSQQVGALQIDDGRLLINVSGAGSILAEIPQ